MAGVNSLQQTHSHLCGILPGGESPDLRIHELHALASALMALQKGGCHVGLCQLSLRVPTSIQFYLQHTGNFQDP